MMALMRRFLGFALFRGGIRRSLLVFIDGRLPRRKSLPRKRVRSVFLKRRQKTPAPRGAGGSTAQTLKTTTLIALNAPKWAYDPDGEPSSDHSLMQAATILLTQPRDLVLQLQLATFQLGDHQAIGGRVGERFRNFILQRPVALFQIRKIG
jgi:hypothetical protein